MSKLMHQTLALASLAAFSGLALMDPAMAGPTLGAANVTRLDTPDIATMTTIDDGLNRSGAGSKHATHQAMTINDDSAAGTAMDLGGDMQHDIGGGAGHIAPS